jgi:hypothetical protein
MDIEQLPPNKPKFLRILFIFCGTIIVIFAVALAFLHFDRRHITFNSTLPNHTQLTTAQHPTPS